MSATKTESRRVVEFDAAQAGAVELAIASLQAERAIIHRYQVPAETLGYAIKALEELYERMCEARPDAR